MNFEDDDLTAYLKKNLKWHPKNRELIVRYIIENMESKSRVIDYLFFPFCGYGENEANICYTLLDHGITIKNIILVDI